MTRKTSRLWPWFVRGGSVVLGIGITCISLPRQREQKKFLVEKSFCETEAKHGSESHFLKKDAKCSSDQVISENLLKQARSLVERVKEEKGCPGLAITVTLNGKTVWSEGFGYSDVENDVSCKPTTVMRIASISKPLTATAAMILVEEGKLNLDDPVQKYVPSFPEKQVNSKECTITVRHLLSHLSGIRHYHKRRKEQESSQPDIRENLKGKQITDVTKEESDFNRREFYIKECYDSVEKSLSLFKDDPLVHEPGSEYLYTTYGFTLLSAVIESASGQEFKKYMMQLFQKIGMSHTHADLHNNLIYGRARFYVRDPIGRLKNTPYVDNCYKLAGGGFLSTTEDLVKFGNAMLYSSQVRNYQLHSKTTILPGILSPESMSLSWEIVQNTERKVGRKGGYGLGWDIFSSQHDYGCCRDVQKAIMHTGGAVGASSLLLVLPNSEKNEQSRQEDNVPPRGIVVAILVNMEHVSLARCALEICEIFKKFPQK